jgi:arylformamidase
MHNQENNIHLPVCCIPAEDRHLGNTLAKAGIPYQVFGARKITHNQLNDSLGIPDNPATIELFRFLDPLMGTKP